MQQQNGESQLPQLPEAVLVSILQQVPLRQRLSCCALVSKGWASAAALTTAQLEAELASCIRWEHVQDFLDQHAEQVDVIRFSHHGQSKQLLQLPSARLSRLQQLRVDRMTIRLQDTQNSSSTGLLDVDCSAFSHSCAVAPAGSHTLVAVGTPTPSILPKLQQLDLFSCALSLGDLMQLSQVTSLTSLSMYNSTVTQDTVNPAGEDQVTPVMTTVLQGLTNLCHLSMVLMALSPSAIFPISNMLHLQHLQLYISTDDDHTDRFLTSLPSSLTSVEVQDMSITPGPGVTAQLSRLTSLRHLKLEELDMDPSVLHNLTGLQSLVLDAVYLVPLAEPQATAAAPASINSSISVQSLAFNRAAQALFIALEQLMQLQHLELSRMQLDEVVGQQQLAALTASGQLTSLHVLARFSMPLPKGSLQHVLQDGLQLAQLQVLRLQGSDGVLDVQCLDGSDIVRIAACCPGLRDLTLKGVVSVGVDLAPLLQLQSSLTALSFAGAAFGDSAAGCIAQLTGLLSMEWCDSPGLTDSGLQQLAALTAVTRLQVKACKGLSRAILPPDTWYTASKLQLESGLEVGASDVWSQLQQLCERAALPQDVAESVG